MEHISLSRAIKICIKFASSPLVFLQRHAWVPYPPTLPTKLFSLAIYEGCERGMLFSPKDVPIARPLSVRQFWPILPN